MKSKIIGMDREIALLKTAVSCHLPVLLQGETGCGKTYVIRELAAREGKNLVRINLNGETGTGELIGKWLLRDGTTVWQDGVLLSAIRRGAWIVLDEINAALPEVLFVLNSLLDDGREIIVPERDNEIVRLHEDCRIFATMNPAGYSGVKDLNRALLSRFGAVVSVFYPAPSEELKIIKMHVSEIADEEARVLVDIANLLRKTNVDGKTTYSASTRDVVQAATLYVADGMTLQECVLYAMLGKAPDDERAACIEAIKNGLKIELPADTRRGKIPALLADYRKTIDALEAEREELKKRADELRAKLGAVIDDAKKQAQAGAAIDEEEK